MAGDLIPYISGGTADIPNYEELKRRRAIATALASRQRPYPKTFGEGLTALGEGVGDAMYDYRLNQMEKAQLAAGRGALAGAPDAAAAPPPAAPPVAARPAPVAAPPVAARPVGAVPSPAPPVGPPVLPTRPATPPNDPRMLFDPRSVSAADPRASIAQAIMQRDGNAPEEVAQENPTAGGMMTPATNSPGISAGLPGSDPIRLASLGPDAGGVMTDAPPIGGRPMPVPEENPPTPTEIQPIPVRTQVAQAGPGLIPGAVAGVPGMPAPGAPPAPGGRPGAQPDMSQGIRPAPSPQPYPDPGPEPRPPTATRTMTYYRGIASDPRFDDTTRAEAARRYSEEKATLDQAFNRKYEMWKDAYTKKRDYELNDPAHRLTLEQANLANVKAIRDLEGEGFLPLTPAELAGLPKMPEGQVVYKNRRGELKFGPTPPASTTINIDQKAQGKGLEELQKEMAKVFVDQFKEGIAASDDVRTLNEMRVLAGRIDTGLGPVVQSTLGKIGIKTEGLSEIQAYNALINRITPQQRVPGTGATSDFDATMFKNSIPALVNTRDGNMLIMNTMEGLANNKLARAQIAGKVISNQIDIAQGTKEMLQLQAEARALSDRVKEHVEKSGVKLPEPILKGPEDAAAWDWLKANPDHPKAPEIRKRLGL